jgi:hypothetical protein
MSVGSKAPAMAANWSPLLSVVATRGMGQAPVRHEITTRAQELIDQLLVRSDRDEFDAIQSVIVTNWHDHITV